MANSQMHENPEKYFTEQIKENFKKFFDKNWDEQDYTDKIKEHKEDFSSYAGESLEELVGDYWVDFKDDFLHEEYRDKLPVPYDEVSLNYFRSYLDLTKDDLTDEDASKGGLYEFANDVLCDISLEDYREEEEEEEWFNQQSFKGTSWNYVLDEAEKHFKCSLNSEMNDKERLIHDCLYKLWNKLKEEEEEEEEEVRCVCPKCFAEGHTFVSKQRAKELEEMEEMEEMCPFGEKCNGEEEEE